MGHRKEGPSGSQGWQGRGLPPHSPPWACGGQRWRESRNIIIGENPKGRRAWHRPGQAEGMQVAGGAGGSQTTLSRWLSPPQSPERLGFQSLGISGRSGQSEDSQWPPACPWGEGGSEGVCAPPWPPLCIGHVLPHHAAGSPSFTTALMSLARPPLAHLVIQGRAPWPASFLQGFGRLRTLLRLVFLATSVSGCWLLSRALTL